MYKTKNTAKFNEWIATLDDDTKGIVLARIARMRQGNFGVSENVGNGVHEAKINHGLGIASITSFFRTPWS